MTPAPHAPTRRGYGIFQMRMPIFMVVVAGVALVSWAALFYAENRSPERAMLSRHLHLLRDTDPIARRDAANLLDQVKPGDLVRVVPALMATMRDPDPRVRRAATQSLALAIGRYFQGTNGETPPERDAASLALIARLGDDDAAVRAAAARGIEALCRPVRLVRADKVESLAPGLEPKVVSAPLRRALDDPDPAAAVAAARTLVELKIDLPGVVAALGRLARKGLERERAWTVFTLARALRQQAAPPDPLIAFLADDQPPEVRRAALRMLLSPWPRSGRAAAALAGRLGRGDWTERALAAQSLASLDPPPDEAVPALARALDDAEAGSDAPDERLDVERYATLAILQASPGARRGAAPALVRAARRFLMAQPHLGRLPHLLNQGPDAPLGPLVAALAELVRRGAEGRDPFSRTCGREAATILADLGPAAAAALPALEVLAQVDHVAGGVDQRATEAILAVGPDSREAALTIVRLAEAVAGDPPTSDPRFAAAILRDLKGRADLAALLGTLRAPDEAARAAEARRIIDRL